MPEQSLLSAEQDVKATQSSLTEKLNELGDRVTDVTETAAHAVTETIETVKGKVQEATATVSETVKSVTSTFDIRTQVQSHPAVVLGGAALAGFCIGRLVMGPLSEAVSHSGAASGRSWGSALTSVAGSAVSGIAQATHALGGEGQTAPPGEDLWSQTVNSISAAVHEYSGHFVSELMDSLTKSGEHAKS